MQFRLIHGTIAIFGDRAAISDLAILTELVISVAMALFSTAFVEHQDDREEGGGLGSAAVATADFLLLSSMVDFGLAFLVVGFVLGIAKGDDVTGGRLVFSLLGSSLSFAVPALRLAAHFKSPSPAPMHARAVVLICLECLLGLTFVLDFARGVYYMGGRLRFTHLGFGGFILTLLTPPTLAILFEIWYYEHPAELLLAGSGADHNETLGGEAEAHEKISAVYVMSATPSQAAINVILIVGGFMGDRYDLTNAFFAFFGAVNHLTIGSIFVQEAIDPRFAVRRARTSLAAAISLICGASYLLAAVMFAVMKEEQERQVRVGRETDDSDDDDIGLVRKEGLPAHRHHDWRRAWKESRVRARRRHK